MIRQTDSERRRRGILWGVGFATLFLAIYGSFLPMRFQEITPQQVWQDFRDLPWLQLSVYRRADWVANGLILLLPSFLMSAAIDWGRPSRLRLFMIAPTVVAGLCVVAVAIEYFQAYVPIRTQSLNDLAAGCVGALLGPLAYLAFGRPFAYAVFRVHDAPVDEKLRWVIAVFVLANLAYAVMPLDLMISPSDYQAKYQAGRLVAWPDVAVAGGRLFWKGFVLSLFRGSVFAALVASVFDRRRAIVFCVIFAVLYEFMQVPVFSRDASVWDVIASVCGIPLGMLAVYAAKRFRSVFELPLFWLILGGLGLLLVSLLTLGRSTGWVPGDDVLQARWEAFWDWPLAKYYFTSEFEAGSNILAKLGVFAVPGGCFAIGVSQLSRGRAVIAGGSACVLVIAAAVSIEVTQVYLEPHIADASDVLLYIFGAILGAFAVQFVRSGGG